MTTTDVIIGIIDWMGNLDGSDILVFGKWILGIFVARWVMRWFYRWWKKMAALPSKPKFFAKLVGVPWRMAQETFLWPFQRLAHDSGVLMLIVGILSIVPALVAAEEFANWLIRDGGTTGADWASFRSAYWGTLIGCIALPCAVVKYSSWICQQFLGKHPNH